MTVPEGPPILFDDLWKTPFGSDTVPIEDTKSYKYLIEFWDGIVKTFAA